MVVQRYKPNAEVTFFTEEGQLVARGVADPNSKVDNDIVAVYTNRDIGEDAPVFNITLTNRKPWHRWITANDMLIIKMCRPPEALAEVMFGLVDFAGKTVDANNDAPSRTISVKGRGFAKAFIQFDIGIVPEAQFNIEKLGWVQTLGITLDQATPDQLAKAAYDKIAKPFINYKWKGSKALFDILKTKFSARKDMKLLDTSGLMAWQGSLLGMYNAIAEKPFHEIFYEVENGSPTMVIRETPFNKDKWDKLPSVEIGDQDVVTDDTGRGDLETYTMFSVSAKTLMAPDDMFKTFGVRPYWYPPYKNKYGIRRLTVETSYLAVNGTPTGGGTGAGGTGVGAGGTTGAPLNPDPPGVGGNTGGNNGGTGTNPTNPTTPTDPSQPNAGNGSQTTTNQDGSTGTTPANGNGTGSVDLMKGLMEDLYNWNILNNHFYSGNLVVKGSNKYKVGTRLVYKSVEDNSTIEYYIKSVTQNFNTFGAWVTTLGVIRGCEPSKRFSPPVGKFEQYEGHGFLGDNSTIAEQKASGGLPNLNDLWNQIFGGMFGGGGLLGGLIPGLGGGLGVGIDGSAAQKVVAGAQSILQNGINGVRVHYTFGGGNPASGALDCSSFTQYVYKTYAGIDIGRVTGEQVKKGTEVSKQNLQPGDLVFFKNTYNSGYIYGVSHVGIYVGNGNFIENSSSKSVTLTALSNSYATAHWLMGRRVLAASTGGGGAGGGAGGAGNGQVSAGAGGTKFIATVYSSPNIDNYSPNTTTAVGAPTVEGVTIAVDPKVIPLHSQVQITCPSYPAVNGTYTAQDTGSAIKGNRIDIYWEGRPPRNAEAVKKAMNNFGKKEVFVKVLRYGKG